MKSLSIDAAIVPIIFRVKAVDAAGNVAVDGASVQALAADMPSIAERVAAFLVDEGHPSPVAVTYHPA
jgi:hypothetical protein